MTSAWVLPSPKKGEGGKVSGGNSIKRSWTACIYFAYPCSSAVLFLIAELVIGSLFWPHPIQVVNDFIVVLPFLKGGGGKVSWGSDTKHLSDACISFAHLCASAVLFL